MSSKAFWKGTAAFGLNFYRGVEQWLKFHGNSIEFEGVHHVPKAGPAMIASWHLSHFDSIIIPWSLISYGRFTRYLAKSEMFSPKESGHFHATMMHVLGHIPVYREIPGGGDVLRKAEDALNHGELIAFYPEGTTRKTPDLQPIRPKKGVVALAMKLKIPVVPCATWGGQWIWSYHVKTDVKTGNPTWVKFGPSLMLHEMFDCPRKATDHLMGVIEELGAPLKLKREWRPEMSRLHKP